MSDPGEWIESAAAGVAIDPQTLLPVVVDEAAADVALAGEDIEGRIVVLLARGDAVGAADLLAEARVAEPKNFALKILDMHVLRVSGNPERALHWLRAMLDEYAGTGHEAVIQQHLGTMYFATGDYLAAATRFRAALALRQAAGDPEALVESSRRALAAAEARAGRGVE
ncbi:hypothetical protein NCCP1664_06740 [Zafaria cholistanensis]|uniref:Tetratricopeptide repeat protein n=1 Tax=Zafaria cholistanensis TaxID=1682741 RepID=A0A5A7NQD3_9MICC|nr:tetratricopeptide repeat protein [Zafaria cholistanensis]GER22177.1 hypothetical protein NCCP1664_06740 [Zafaria cholistanensis]